MSRFNQKEIDMIMSYVNRLEWNQALILMADYIEKYPRDLYIKLCYVNLLLKVGNFELARNIYDTISISASDDYYNRQSYYYSAVKLFIMEERYEECLKFLKTNPNLFKDKKTIYYAKALCGDNVRTKVKASYFDAYVFKQLKEYCEDDTLEYIKTHAQIDGSQDKGKFYPEFDIDHCFKIIKSRVSETEKRYPGIFLFETYFKATNCGTYNGEKVDFILINGIVNTNNILLMHPEKHEINYPYIDITSDLYSEKKELKRVSQIEKFENKYGKH